jgi:outer membrane lipoprotein SlyB
LVAALSLVGCDRGQDSGSTSTADAALPSEATAAPSQPKPLRWWTQVRDGECAQSQSPDYDIQILSSDGSRPVVTDKHDQAGAFVYTEVFLPRSESHESVENVYFQDKHLCETISPDIHW